GFCWPYPARDRRPGAGPFQLRRLRVPVRRPRVGWRAELHRSAVLPECSRFAGLWGPGPWSGHHGVGDIPPNINPSALVRRWFEADHTGVLQDALAPSVRMAAAGEDGEAVTLS